MSVKNVPTKGRSASRPKRRPAARPGSPGALTGKLVRIGNSRGVRLPKTLIEQAGLTDNVEILVAGHEIVIRSATAERPRADWDERFKKALADLGPDALEREREEWADWQNLPNEFDEKEWTW